ncbi:MAG TPA: Gfo/Idh/MocA family oxidoreductase [Pirellulales bacterium]|nr:Gfo/Idh/MocA family oxidoreductase [Pirellulales bacterium]
MMELTPEEKAVGKSNFHAAIGDSLTRREFLERSIAAGVVSGAGLGAFYYGYEKIKDPVRVGFIGTGDEGSVLIGAHTPDYLQVVAIADIRPYNIHRAFHGDPVALGPRPGLMAKCGWKSEDEARKHVKIYDQDYKDLLKDPDVEAVVIALPLHLHDVVAIEAMQAGKHVLTEKLMGYSVARCKNMARVANKLQKHLATGHQRHYSVLYDNAVDMIQRGLLGDLHSIRAQWHRTKDSWYAKLPDESLVKELEGQRKKLLEAAEKKDNARIEALSRNVADLEYRLLDKDKVDAEKYGYQRKTITQGSLTYECSPLEELIRWRLWQRTGGGLMAELGSHQLDAAGIFCTAVRKKDADGHVQKSRPLTVSAVGGRHLYPLNRECDDHVYCMFEYPGPDYESDPNKKIVVTYSSINGNGFGGYGEVVMGTEGTLVLEVEKEVMLYSNAGASTHVKVAKGKSDKPVLSTSESGASPAATVGKKALDAGPVSRGYTEELEHFAWCIRNFDFEKNKPKCHPEVALADAVIALTTNLAIARGERIEFKDEWFKIDRDETPEGDKPEVAV